MFSSLREMRRIAHSRWDPKVPEVLIGMKLWLWSLAEQSAWNLIVSSRGYSSASHCGASRLISRDFMWDSWSTKWHWRRVFSESLPFGPLIRTSFSVPTWVVRQSCSGSTLLHPRSLNMGIHFDQTLEWLQSNDDFLFCFVKLAWRSRWESRTPLAVHESQVFNYFYAITN